MRKINIFYLNLILFVLIMPTLGSTIIQAMTPTTSFEFETTADASGTETYTAILRTTWSSTKYHEVKLTVNYQQWSYWIDGDIYTYQAWKFTIVFEMNKVNKDDLGDVIQYWVGDENLYFEQYRVFMDGQSITRSYTYAWGAQSIGNLDINLYVCSRVRPDWYLFHQTWHYKIWNHGQPVSGWDADMWRTY